MLHFSLPGDILISVKTSEKFHKSRLIPILSTWYPLARDSTFFFTDSNSAQALESELGVEQGHAISTSCPADHSRQALCCKMEAELKFFLLSDER